MKIYLSLGANLGQRGETLREALRRLSVLPQVRLLAVAPFYETAPWGNLEQPPFLNTAAVVETTLTPREFLQASQQIEQALGRVRHEHWGARTIDIDLLAADGYESDTEELRLPHPYLTERAFVLVPLGVIAPQLVIKGRTIADWCRDEQIQAQEITPAPELHEPYPLRMIACVDEQGGIGRQGQLLVHNDADMAHFRRLTLGQVVIMGSRTLASLPGGRPLPDRVNIVLSKKMQRDDVQVCHNLTELWTLLGRLQAENPRRKFICIGGGEIYALLLPYAKELLLTKVD
ncbi:MAG: 2-amino-4-hydroxy-6-hydroxymethyldihydropteridine diphosphokinase, partial [Selenomonas sp.]|nr:2-amino-4-hydroxy-6-hydroxymethyldihydropteridine diphosphokinase [Selenomonas sp.]